MPLDGKPMLAYVLERLRSQPGLPARVVLTSDDRSDDPIASFCAQEGEEYFRGSLDDVAGRFQAAIAHYGPRSFVRVSGDSPFLDAQLVQRGLDLSTVAEVDIVTNVRHRTFPRGESVEVVRSHTFTGNRHRFTAAAHREHVTAFFYDHASEFRIVNFESGDGSNSESLAVDSRSDFETAARIIGAFERPHWAYGWREIVALKRRLTSTNGGQSA